jgi:Ca2+/Na+ antiporter
MKLLTTALKCLLTWLTVLVILLLLSSAFLRLRFKEAVKMTKPDYEYVIQPKDQKNVNRYIVLKEKYTIASFIASLIILPSAVALSKTELRAGQTSTTKPTEPPKVGPFA